MCVGVWGELDVGGWEGRDEEEALKGGGGESGGVNKLVLPFQIPSPPLDNTRQSSMLAYSLDTSLSSLSRFLYFPENDSLFFSNCFLFSPTMRYFTHCMAGFFLVTADCGVYTKHVYMHTDRQSNVICLQCSALAALQ